MSAPKTGRVGDTWYGPGPEPLSDSPAAAVARCAFNIGTPDVCRCILPVGHAGKHRCIHENAEEVHDA